MKTTVDDLGGTMLLSLGTFLDVLKESEMSLDAEVSCAMSD
jgi:hypothetical protein